MEKTIIKCKKDLYNDGKCFSKGKTYEVNGNVTMKASLMEKVVINDLDQPHKIGSWWKEFEII